MMVDKMAGYVACKGEMIKAHKILVWKYQRKRYLGRSRCMWEDNIKTNLWQIGYKRVDWIKVAQYRSSAFMNIVTCRGDYRQGMDW
jgi:hypothetical protein